MTARRDAAWLSQYLAAPDKVLAAGDPIASALYAKYHQIPMPNLGLSSEDVADLLAYLEAQNQPAAVGTREAATSQNEREGAIGGPG